MEYWVVMNKEELKVALVLLEKESLPGIIEIEPDYMPELSTLQMMLDKHFFEEGDGGRKWSPFVRAVLTCAFYAQSELRIEDNSEMVCRLYFYDESMVMLTKGTEEDQFVFYYVPLLPKAIGCLAKCLEGFEDEMVADDSRAAVSFTNLSEINSASSLISVICESDLFSDRALPRLTVEGWLMGELDLIKALLQAHDGFWLAGLDDNEVQMIPVDYYEFIQDLSRWIVRTHGQSIRKAGVYNG